MRINVPNRQLIVAVSRSPFTDKTNTLEMPKCNTKKRTQSRNIKIDTSVPYCQSSHLNNNENIKPKCTVNENRNDFIVHDKCKRIAKKATHAVETVSKTVTCNYKSSQSRTNPEQIRDVKVKDVDANKIVSYEKCHDPLFNMECRVNVERANVQKYLKLMRSEDANKKDTGNENIPKISVKIQDEVVKKDQPFVNKTSQVQPLITHKELRVCLPRSAPLISLRKQMRPNYAEITLNSSQEDMPKKLPDTQQTCATKVPVYRQKLEDDKFKKPDKLYDFDESDTELYQQHKKTKRNTKKPKPTSSIYTIFQFGNTKRRRLNPNKKAPKSKAPVRKYDDIMQQVVKRVMKKVSPEPLNKNIKKVALQDTKQPNTVKNINMQKILAPKTNVPQNSNAVTSITLEESKKVIADKQSIQRDVNKIQPGMSCDVIVPKILDTTTPVVQNICKIRNNVKNRSSIAEEINVASDFDNLSRSLFEKSKSEKEPILTENVMNAAKEDVPLKGYKSSSLHAEFDGNFSDHDIIDNNESSSDQEGSLDESFLDFGSNVHFSTPINNIPKVNVISNVVLKKKRRSKNKSEQSENPWRFNQAVKRNPHFIILKNTALPCLKQDMVLDHDQVEKIEEHFSKTPQRFGTPKKSPVQTSILNYVNSPNRRDKENAPRPSLFDYEDFSPVKLKSPHRNEAGKAKRNILGPIQDNASNILPFTSTPTKPFGSRHPLVMRDENDDVDNCFGFDVTGSPIPREKSRLSDAKPFRIKEYAFKKQTKEMTKEKDIEDVPVQEIDPDESQVASEGLEVELFDDPEKAFSLTVPSKIYYRKPRRKRLKSIEGDNHEDEHHPKKRKKDMMTKAEEAALEDWAAKFNSMCREIEKYDLEIE